MSRFTRSTHSPDASKNSGRRARHCPVMHHRSCQVERLEERTLLSFGGFSGPIPIDIRVGPPQDVELGDLNRDGKLDLVTTYPRGGSVSVLLGDGRGGFGMPRHLAVNSGGQPTSVAIADLNRDGKLDILAADAGHYGQLSGFFGIGDGTFGPLRYFEARTSAVAVSDFNSDGSPDIAAVTFSYSSSPDQLIILLNNGSGQFSRQQALTINGSGRLDAGDVNGDSKPDIVLTTSASSTASVYLGNGNGTVRFDRSISLSSLATGLKLADLNADRKLDLVVSDARGSVYLGDGRGVFSLRSEAPAFGSRAVADVDRDGKPDLIITDRVNKVITLRRGNGDGTFAGAQAFLAGDPNSTETSPSDVALGDLNGDGSLDMAVGHGYEAQCIPCPTDKTSTHVTVLLAQNAPAGTLQFGTGAYSVNENAGTATIQVTRANGTAGTVTVDYITVGMPGGATPGVDFVATRGTLTFGPGETSKTFSVTTLDDTAAEGNESIILVLTNPTGGASLGSQSYAPLTIADNDVAIEFTTSAYSVNETAGTATVMVTRRGDVSRAVAVNYITVGWANRAGYATPGADFGWTPGTLSFLPGETSKSFTVKILDDTLVEGNELVGLALYNPTGGATLGTRSSSWLTIVDNDFASSALTASVLLAPQNGRASTAAMPGTNPSALALDALLDSRVNVRALIGQGAGSVNRRPY